MSDATTERAGTEGQLAAVGEMAAGVANELGAPVTAISVAVQYLLKGPAGQDEATRRELETVLSQARRISQLSRRLVDLARPADPQPRPVELNRLVAESVAVAERALRREGVEVEVALDPAVAPVSGDPDQLRQVLTALLRNAQRAVSLPGGAEPRVTVRTRAARGAAEVVVADTGPGIAEADLPRVFLPFFSRTGGAGLGLTLARGIAHRHGGALRVASAPGGGATFTLSLPSTAHADQS